MLRAGQKVKVSPTTRSRVTGELNPICGQITTIIRYAEDESKFWGRETYYIVGSQHPITRRALWPIDDEPCDKEFLEEFKNMRKDNANV